jgi:hypothetical protein
MSETAAVMWKEWTEIFNQGMKWRDWLVALMFLAIFGVFSPWLHGSMWLSSSLFLFTYGFLAGAVAAVPTIESFAGERERHTLETLLATPLSDRAIGPFLSSRSPRSCLSWTWCLSRPGYGGSAVAGSHWIDSEAYREAST